MKSKTAITFFHNVSNAILNPLITLLFAAALLVFLYGTFQFVRGGDNDESRAQGKRHMFWGIFGLFIMVSVFGIIKFIATTIGADVSDVRSVLPI
jgi:uncharacterized membrane protein